MDPYYSSPSYYYQSSCPLHDSYTDPYASYLTPSTPLHPPSSYYYPSYIDQSSPQPQVVLYNNSTASIYGQPTPPNQATHSTPVLNKTFESVPPVGRRRRQRTIFLQDQVAILDQVFEKNRYPDIQLREQLSQRLDVPEARIQVYF